MSTQINVTVGPRTLLQRAKTTQETNRLNQTQEEIDQQYLEDVRRIEAQELQRQAEELRNRGVPEYEIKRFTSAQRVGGSFGIGWMYESYEDALEHDWATQEQYRIAVGSGDGTVWDFVDLSQPIASVKPELTLNGFFDEGVEDVDTIDLGEVIPEELNNQNCPATFTYQQKRIAKWTERYGVSRENVYFIIPIGGQPDSGCILVGCARLAGKSDRTYKPEAVGGDFIFEQEGVITNFSGTSNNVSLRFDVPGLTTEGFATTCTYLSIYNYRTITNNPNPPQFDEADRPLYQWVVQNGEGGIAPFVKPEDVIYFEQRTRVNYAFYISEKKCRKLEMPSALDDALNEWLPTEDDLAWANSPVDTDGPAWGLRAAVPGFLKIRYGSPGIFDIINDDFNFERYNNENPVQSVVTTRIGITAPDSQTPTSAFSYGAQVQAGGGQIVSEYPAEEGTESLYIEPFTFVFLDAYIYLNPTWRADSAYFEFADSATKAVLENFEDNPAFWYWYKAQNPEGVRRNPEEGFPTLLPDGAYQTAARLRLSPQRILPPAIFNPSDTGHPLIRPQPVPYRHGGTSFLPGPSAPRRPYSLFPWSSLLWTGWQAPRQDARLLALGFTASDLRP